MFYLVLVLCSCWLLATTTLVREHSQNKKLQ